jgi:hypothetical protein
MLKSILITDPFLGGGSLATSNGSFFLMVLFCFGGPLRVGTPPGLKMLLKSTKRKKKVSVF